MQGRRIKDLPDLILMANNRRAVVIPTSVGFKKPRAAAFVQNLQARLVHDMLRRGIYLWLPKARSKKK